MGRAIKMERLAAANSRQNTYSKRKFGIIKKAKELSILCDVDVLLVMFSPAGRPAMYLGEYSYWAAPEKVNSLAKIQEMEKSLLKSLELLRRQKKHQVKVRIAEKITNNIAATDIIFYLLCLQTV
ncbi:hypothetical protein ACLOJK_033792 [Asimina triloba]